MFNRKVQIKIQAKINNQIMTIKGLFRHHLLLCLQQNIRQKLEYSKIITKKVNNILQYYLYLVY
jgi:hypothetical protein